MRKTSAMTMARRTPSPSTSPLSAISGVVSVSPSRSSSARRWRLLARVRREPLRLLADSVAGGTGSPGGAPSPTAPRIGRALTLFAHCHQFRSSGADVCPVGAAITNGGKRSQRRVSRVW